MANHSPHFPSDLVEFGSFLIYPSPANTEAEKKAKTFILDLKRNAVTREGSVIQIMVDRLRAAVPGSCLADLLDGTAVLVPTPGSAPLLRNAVWCARSVCEAMVAAGLGSRMLTCVQRVSQIRKSAYCAIHNEPRPTPREHYDTMTVRTLLDPPENIVLVDDVITRGATFAGAAARLSEAFPHAQIRAFAVAHTERGMERFASPCVGRISSYIDGSGVNRVNAY
jgi:hypothetical protein